MKQKLIHLSKIRCKNEMEWYEKVFVYTILSTTWCVIFLGECWMCNLYAYCLWIIFINANCMRQYLNELFLSFFLSVTPPGWYPLSLICHTKCIEFHSVALFNSLQLGNNYETIDWRWWTFNYREIVSILRRGINGILRSGHLSVTFWLIVFRIVL